MATKYENLVALSSAQFDINSATDKATLTIPFKCRVYRAQVISASAATGGASIHFESYVTSSTVRGAADIADITLPASSVLGLAYFDNVARGTILDVGQQVIVQVVSEGSGGSTYAYAQLIVDYIPEVEGNQAKMVETA